jgi:hypothetical protein
VDVDIEIDEIVKELDTAGKAELMAKLAGGGIPFGLGDGDTPRANNIIERAYLAARNLPNLPREVADLFWVVHGRAL